MKLDLIKLEFRMEVFMGPERLDPNQMSERDRQMMGLGVETGTEEDDDEEKDGSTHAWDQHSWDKHAWDKPEGTDKEIGAEHNDLSGARNETTERATPKDRFANLEMTTPGMEGEELANWKKEQDKEDKEAKENLRNKQEEERENEPDSSKYF